MAIFQCDLIREEEENNLPQMKKLFFFFHLVKHIRKRTIQTGRLFFSSSLRLKSAFLIIHYPL